MIIGPPSTPPGLDRVVAAVRLQLMTWPTSVALSWAILGLAFATNWVLWRSLDIGGDAWTGGLASIYVVVFSVYITAMTQVFPLAVGFGITRRSFYLAMAALAGAQALTYSLVLELLGLIEAGTSGWGVGLAFFRPPPLAELSSPARLAASVVLFLVLAHVGICIGVVHQRWGATGIYSALGAVVAAVAAVVVAVTQAGWWGAVGDVLTGRPVAQLLVLWPLPLLAVLVGTGWTGIRRAVP